MTDVDDGVIRLTEWTSCGGCAAKWGAAPLSALVRELASAADPALLVGLAPFDDAAVYRVSGRLAVVSTTDFFPPLVDDPSDFGAIAAANACSDVFAMGGRVVMALNISAFPERMPLRDASGRSCRPQPRSSARRGGVVAGGHTIRSARSRSSALRCRASCTRRRSSRRPAPEPGDVLVLSKPLGTGIVLAGGTSEPEGGRDRADAGVEPRRVRGAVRDGRGSARRHRRDRLRVVRPRMGDGRAIRYAARVRCCAAASLRRAPRRCRGRHADRRRRSQPRAPRRPRPVIGVARAARGALLRPADIGGSARRRRPVGRVGRARRPGSPSSARWSAGPAGVRLR